MLECVGPFLRGRERIRGCKVGITRNRRRYFYMVYTKYRKTEVNYAIMDESGNQGSWKGPLVVMRLDAMSATRLVSITSKVHEDMAMQVVAKYVFLVTVSHPSHSTIDKVHKYHECQYFYPTVQDGAVAPKAAGGRWLKRLKYIINILFEAKCVCILPALCLGDDWLLRMPADARIFTTPGNVDVTLHPPGHEIVNQLVGNVCPPLQKEVVDRSRRDGLGGDNGMAQSSVKPRPLNDLENDE
jgi:hypothetical protein